MLRRSLRSPRSAFLVAVASLAVLGSASGCDSSELEAKVKKLETELAAKNTELEAATANAATEAQTSAVEDLAAANEKIATLEKNLEAAKGEKGELASELKRKEKALKALEALESSLAATLVAEVEAGEISVKERDGYLVVNVSDKVLFSSGSAELSERGQKVIVKLGESLKTLPEEPVFQVGGHTDNQPIKSEEVLAKFPTNWELSTARATNVVRFLQDNSEIPGERLVAAGFSQYRPAASNKKPNTRKKNRRIEIALLPPRG